MRCLQIVRAGALVAVLLAGCGRDEPDTTAAHEPLLAEISARSEAATRSDAPASIIDVLRERDIPWADVVVEGSVVEVEAGSGFVDVSDDPTAAGDGRATNFDDAQAAWRTVHMSVEVDRVLVGDEVHEGDVVVVGLAFGRARRIDDVREELMKAQLRVFPLTKSAVFAYDDRVWGTTLDGELLISVDDGGRLHLPAAPQDRAAGLLGETPTIDVLRAAAEDVEPDS